MSAAIVTGSDSGIGRAIAAALARDGFDIGVTWHTDDAGAAETARLVREVGRDVWVSRLDLSDVGGVSEVVDGLADRLGRVDALVNNAAINPRASVLDETIARWRHVLDVNLTGPLICAQTAAARMIRQGSGGRVVNITSIHEHVPLADGAAYAAAKTALGMLTKVMALEWAPHSITVNSVAPGHIATPMTTAPQIENAPDVISAIPLGLVGQPEDVAGVVALLCSGDGAYITGASYRVDGGLGLNALAGSRPRADSSNPDRARTDPAGGNAGERRV